MKTVTIMLAEDHEVVRQALRRVLEAEPGFFIVGEASDGLGVGDLAEQVAPDVLVLDLMMPGLSGLAVARDVARRAPHTRVVVLSMQASNAYVSEALKSGAAGYVTKDAGRNELVRAIRKAAAGRRYLSPPLSETAVLSYERTARDSEVDIYETLTPREREVLHLAAEGRTSSEVAERLDIGPRTADTHIANVMRKLGLHRRAELIRFAFTRGILAVEPSADP